VSTAVGTVIAAINTELAALVPSSGTINGTQVQENIASLLYLAQTSIFNAVPAVSNGTQTAANFTSAYTGVNLTNTADVALQYLTKEAPAFNMLCLVYVPAERIFLGTLLSANEWLFMSAACPIL